MADLHIVGAGLSGLAAAVDASAARRWNRVILYEAAAHAGGRCRSFYDERLGRWIDNGNHLLLGANRAALNYLRTTGGNSAMLVLRPAAIPFLDLENGAFWVLRPNAGPVPWWLFSARRSVSGLRSSILRLATASRQATIVEAVGPASDPAYHRFWDPLATAVLNTAPEEASAGLLRRVLCALGIAGEAGLRPYLAVEGLSVAFVDPALRLLRSRGVCVLFGHRLRSLRTDNRHVSALDFGKSIVPLDRRDAVILALPADVAGSLLPGLPAPTAASPIVNVHFRLTAPLQLPGGYPLLGLVGGTAQWLFLRGDVLSVTVSAAGRVVDLDRGVIARHVWKDIVRATGGAAEPTPPPARVIKERRATILQTPEQLARRPQPITRYENLVLAGDWVETGLPATIEAAIRSGRRAVRLLARW